MLRRVLAETGDALVSVFFPGGCRLCERLLTRASRLPICEECLGAFPALPLRVCPICGSPALAATTLEPRSSESESPPGSERRTCLDCAERTYRFDCARSYAAYRGTLARAVVLLVCLGMVACPRPSDVVAQCSPSVRCMRRRSAEPSAA